MSSIPLILTTTNHTNVNGFLKFIEEFLDFKFTVLPPYFYIISSICALFCILFAGLMSGLTIGLLSLDKMQLEILSNEGTEVERKRAKRISKLIKHQHWLLVTLLLSNSLAMEALPVFINQMLPSGIAIIMSVTFILFFSEIIPQALCSRFGMAIGSFILSYILVCALMIITAPISWPVSKLLDLILGKTHGTFYRRGQLKELVKLHGKNVGKKKIIRSSFEDSEKLTKDEVTVIKGVLELRGKNVSNIMTKIDDVFMLEINQKLNKETMKDIIEKGHSRIPIYEKDRNNIKGVLLVKRLILLESKDEIEIKSLQLRKIPAVNQKFKAWELLNVFQEGKSHMAVVFTIVGDENEFYDDLEEVGKKKVLGVITLEDIIEEIILEEIYDENDNDNEKNWFVFKTDVLKNLSINKLNEEIMDTPINVGIGDKIYTNEKTPLIKK